MKEKEPTYPKGLIAKLLRGESISREDLDTINEWYYSQEQNSSELNQDLPAIDKSEVLKNIHKKAGIENGKRRKSYYLYYTVAAAISLFLLVGSLYFSFLNNSQSSFEDAGVKSVITKSGERKKGILPDGSTVFLKENSMISYKEEFKEGRKVFLKGEAFFEVKRSSGEEFKVVGDFLETTVLGTEFLVSDKRNSSEMVLVKSGKVMVSQIKSQSERVILEKGQKARFSTKEGILKVSETSNDEKYFAWMDGTLVLDRAHVNDIAKELEAWFGIEVISEAEDTDCKVSGAYNKMNLTEILETINYSVNLNYEQNGEKLIIKSMKCK
ncbi:putative anti-sigma factor [Indibacter alkaliphilus LW1]|uniref:Anti-sigma factor n=1 Tax=Indibacter alkaliphilus (strain CCUG 57479 / KCTC 22604 / LW1) TaxID=1189612 RepID=S2D3K2_INDAL|nr:FecR domain-containing protein [Indibacter alkaliphilus]EOZ91585.1 putative anti-sigma factor [Indibacter alkaliphilus LW1]